MEYIYFLANASLTLRVVHFLHIKPEIPLEFLTIVHQLNGWIVKIKLTTPMTIQQDGDFRAFLNELGISYQPEIRLQMVFWSLETGQSPIDVMRRYQMAVVSHGKPDYSDIQAFREQFTNGLGYCPETLA
ncbi:MAG TPA: hypothetical protein V6C58_04755 [Allocoleopsis sp.]